MACLQGALTKDRLRGVVLVQDLRALEDPEGVGMTLGAADFKEVDVSRAHILINEQWQ